jgi:hypothetical protein
MNEMTCTLHVAWDEQLTDYHFGPDYPLAPVRVELTMRLAPEFGLTSRCPPALEVSIGYDPRGKAERTKQLANGGGERT